MPITEQSSQKIGSSQKFGKFVRMLACAPIVIALIWSGSVAWTRLFAEIHYNAALAQSGSDRAQSLRKALAYIPADYNYNSLAIQVWGARKKYEKRVLKHHQNRVLQRPSWPYGWAELSLAYGKADVRGSKRFATAFAASHLLGPNEPRLRKVKFQFAMRHKTRRFTSQSRELVDGLVMRELKKRPEYVTTYAFVHGSGRRICNLVGTDEHYSEFCSQVNFFESNCGRKVDKSGRAKKWCAKILKIWKDKLSSAHWL